MEPKYILMKSQKKGKKYALKILTGDHEKTINFGAKGYEDYTTHKDPDRKQFYIQRHSKESNFWGHNTEISPSYLSRWLLWEKPNLDEAIKFVEQKRGITIDKQRLN